MIELMVTTGNINGIKLCPNISCFDAKRCPVYQQIYPQTQINATLFGIRAGFCRAPKGFLSCNLSDPSFTLAFTENWRNTENFYPNSNEKP